MPFAVHLTEDAARDLEDICETIERRDSPAGAAHVLDRIEEAFTGLCEHPRRGAFPKELLDIGIREYREVFFKPYRIIYRVREESVYVLLIADGRRDMRTLLERRLLLA
ncbi:MAG: type II toxin-antitoxin system RelE/ParE family toxin [Nitrospinae bacterium]|nr:type II toxin-antitoxin system RelE/ParE family toxin [Nitrospinota bacterium]